MHRYVRSSDYYPTPLRYQYRYFYPTPVLPSSSGQGSHRTHFWNSFGHGGQDYAGDRRERETWAKIMDKGGGLSSETTAIKEHSLKKVLPWRATPMEDVISDRVDYQFISRKFSTGRDVRYNGDADIFGTRPNEKFPNLVNGSNILASHGHKTYTWHGAKQSPTEWNFNNRQLCTGAECAHNKVVMLKSEATQCIGETAKKSARCQIDTHKEIDQRLNDIKVWKQNLQDELKFNIVQSHEILELKERLEFMLKNIEQPLEIAQENLYIRETRQGAELVHDNVEDCLLREIESLRRCEEKLLDEMDKLNSQLTKLRSARHEIEIDIRNKEQAAQTDECVRLLSELSNEIGSIDIPPGMTTLSSPNSWLANTQALIQKSQQERNSSQLLYAVVSRAMLSAADECFGVWYETNGAFSGRISEISTAKRHLERHLHKLRHDTDVLKKHIDDIRKALDEKRPLLQLAQTRLDKRKDRPGIELCRDQATMSLLREIYSLKNSVETLTTKWNEMEVTLQQLLKTKAALEHDLKLKDVALFVDREKCLCLRQTFPISTFKDSRYPKKSGAVGEEGPMMR